MPIRAFQSSIRPALSAGIAVAISQFLGLQFPIYALIAAVIVSDLSPSKTRQLGGMRLLGTLLGAVIGAAVSYFLPQGTWVLGFGVLAAMFLSRLLRLEGAAKVTGYVCGIVVLTHSDNPWPCALDRVVETILGIVVALLLSYVPTLVHIDESSKQDPWPGNDADRPQRGVTHRLPARLKMSWKALQGRWNSGRVLLPWQKCLPWMSYPA